MKIANKIEILELQMKLMGMKRTIYPTLIWDDDNVVLIDAGIANNLQDIKDAMDDVDVAFERLNTILVTHQDIDHIGGIKGIVNELDDVKVLAHVEDAPYIQGEKQIIKLDNPNFMDRINALPEEDMLEFLGMFKNAPVKVDRILSDGQQLDLCGGIMVIHTPGHTPGHICLYHKESKTLIAGDALNFYGEDLVITHLETMNKEEIGIVASWLKKFLEYDVDQVITYHGGLFNNNPNQRIKELYEDLI